MGQMKQTDGVSNVFGSISYVPQEAWLLNMSLRDNILFGSEYDERKYNEVIRVCALRRDLKLMIDGDRTEIGERGINLSGGQRQRISLARCVYKCADNVFLDDPLSAVDQHVGKHIFHECIKKFFKGKTVMFVTHQLQVAMDFKIDYSILFFILLFSFIIQITFFKYLHQVDNIIVIKNGRIHEQGSFNELMAHKGHLATLVGEHVQIIEPSTEFENKTINENEESLPMNLYMRTRTISEHNRLASTSSFKRKPSVESLTAEQSLNRSRLSISNNMLGTDLNFAKHIENHQLSLLGGDEFAKKDTIKIMERNRMSVFSNASEEEEPKPDDASPMKLVLEDQSINYKEKPMMSYLKAGYGICPTITVFVYFFLVHVIRIVSGKPK
jgi:ABC-type multidrug transport system ATPase subunit